MAVRRFVLSGVLILMLLFATACGGGGDKDDAQPTGAAQVTAPSDATPALEGVSKEFADLLTQGLTATFKVTYETTAPDGALGDASIVYNSETATRIDTLPADVAETQSRLMRNGEGDTVGCTGGPDAWSCTSIAPIGESLVATAGPVPYLNASDIALFDVSSSDARNAAGAATECFLLTPRNEGLTEHEYCFSEDGVPLYVRSSSGTTEATEYATEVSDQDFVPPAEPEQ